MHTDTELDIAIVGGGMVGASLALSLRDLPWTVGLIDPRHPAPEPIAPPQSADDFGPRVSALSPASERWLRQLGTWQQLPSHRIGTYHNMQVWDAEGSGELDFDPALADLDYLGHIVENRLIEQTLWTQLADWSSLHLMAGQRVDQVHEAPANATTAPRWHLTLHSGDRVRARLLLIVDGARSPLRDRLGFATRAWSYDQRAVVATVTHEHSHQATARQAFHRQGPLAFLPLSLPHCSSIVWSLDNDAAESFMAAETEAQAEQLARGIGHRLGAVSLAGKALSFPLQQCHAATYITSEAALVGDAAHSIHPLAGQGANLGLKDAAALHKALCWAAEQRIDLTEPLILRRYQRDRQADNLLTMTAMEGFKRLFAPSHPAIHLLRNLGMNRFNQHPSLLRAAVMQATS